MAKHSLKLYFTGSVAARDQFAKNYQKIISSVKEKGHSIIADHIMGISEKEIGMKTREDRLKFHTKIERWIHSCDALIAETSFPSISVGYEISLALRVGKPVLVLYSEGEPPSLLAHHRDEKILCEKYTSSTLPEILEDFIGYVGGKTDLRFTFFITPKIAGFLDQVSRSEHLPKSVYLRKLIEHDMEKRVK